MECPPDLEFTWLLILEVSKNWAIPKSSELDHFSIEPHGDLEISIFNYVLFLRKLVRPSDAGCLPPRKLPGPSARDVFRDLMCNESEHWSGSSERSKKKSMFLPSTMDTYGAFCYFSCKIHGFPGFPVPLLFNFASDIFLWQSCEPSQQFHLTRYAQWQDMFVISPPIH